MVRQHSRRSVLRALAAAGTTVGATQAKRDAVASPLSETDPHTRETVRVLLSAVIPETPALADRLGEEHEAGAVTVGLDEFFVTFLNELLARGVPGVGHLDNARLSEAIAAALDEAAVELPARGDNETPPTAATATDTGGPFARLAPQDRLRAITLFGKT